MSLFGTILEKLGIKKPAAAPKAGAATFKPGPVVRPGTPPRPGTVLPKMDVAPKPAAIEVVDVVAKLEEMAKSKPGLDWKVSIVDLMKLLGLDSSYANRKELATELGCPANLMNDSAAMNTWLHKTVLQKIAENGGNIPQSLL